MQNQSDPNELSMEEKIRPARRSNIYLIGGGVLQHREQIADTVRNKQQRTARTVIVHHRILRSEFKQHEIKMSASTTSKNQNSFIPRHKVGKR